LFTNNWGVYQADTFLVNQSIMGRITYSPLFFLVISFNMILLLLFKYRKYIVLQLPLSFTCLICFYFISNRSPAIPGNWYYFYARYWWSEIFVLLVIIISTALILAVKKKEGLAFVKIITFAFIVTNAFNFIMPATSNVDGGKVRNTFNQIKFFVDRNGGTLALPSDLPGGINATFAVPIEFIYDTRVISKDSTQALSLSQLSTLETSECQASSLDTLKQSRLLVLQTSRLRHPQLGFLSNWIVGLEQYYLCSYSRINS
jgi:hypothetical protein